MDRQLVVKGRGNLTAQSQPGEHHLVIRIDDEKDLAFWAEIVLPLPLLRELVNDVEKSTNQEGN